MVPPGLSTNFATTSARKVHNLLDFYHVSQYLAQAATKVVHLDKQREWTRRQQGRLLNNQTEKILRSLQSHLEPPNTEEAPVSAAHRYLSERHDCLDYAAARAAELPIGSGEVESGHRHVIQRWLKVAGAWWNQINAQAMLNLRTARANRHWSQHWSVQN